MKCQEKTKAHLFVPEEKSGNIDKESYFINTFALQSFQIKGLKLLLQKSGFQGWYCTLALTAQLTIYLQMKWSFTRRRATNFSHSSPLIHSLQSVQLRGRATFALLPPKRQSYMNKNFQLNQLISERILHACSSTCFRSTNHFQCLQCQRL